MQDVPKKLPKSLLNLLNENCGGGYVLFSTDEKGSVNVYTQFDNNLYVLALSSYIKNWSEAIEQVTVDNLMSALTDCGNEDEESEDNI